MKYLKNNEISGNAEVITSYLWPNYIKGAVNINNGNSS